MSNLGKEKSYCGMILLEEYVVNCFFMEEKCYKNTLYTLKYEEVSSIVNDSVKVKAVEQLLSKACTIKGVENLSAFVMSDSDTDDDLCNFIINMLSSNQHNVYLDDVALGKKKVTIDAMPLVSNSIQRDVSIGYRVYRGGNCRIEDTSISPAPFKSYTSAQSSV